ncbi:MAG: M56 family metallopeptidase [Tsuneonella sp.]
MIWLLGTLAWTAALLALVLLLRRPVARYLGPQTAYALWALPVARLLLPPIVLPYWLAPASETPAATAVLTVQALPSGASQVTPPESGFDWLVLVPALWLTGATIFLVLRFGAYFRLRRELLAGARPVGEAGCIRLVETPAVASPIAFGVLDKVIALPAHFMAMHDRRSRDLALEHELAHHRGRDLLVNVLVQPLFALHWFNPLSWLGWRALRRDQEAACDARVMARRGSDERGAYANLIAGLAAGPRLSLAAPMACPVLGDKSIVHRLRSLTMSEVSRRRRNAGRALLGAAVLALPLTASISYAEAPAVPPAPAAPLAPAAVAAIDPAAPLPPAPPAPPAAPLAPHSDHALRQVHVIRTAGHGKHAVELRKISRDGKVTYLENGQEIDEDEFAARMEELGMRLDGLGDQIAVSLAQAPVIDEAMLRKIERDAEKAGREAEKAGRDAERAQRHAMRVVAMAPEVRTDCTRDGNAGTVMHAGGKQIVYICKARVMASAVSGLRAARASLAANADIPASARAEALASIDRDIARMEADH